MKVPKDWACPNAEDICEKVSVGIVIEPSKHYTSDPDGIRAFRSANVRAGKINDSTWVRLSQQGHAANSKSHLRVGDVVIVRTGAPGTACVISEEFAGSNCIDLIFARPRPELLNSHYLCVFINSEHGKKQALNMQGGLAQQHLNVGAFQKIKVPLPPLPEQRKIADILTTWDEAIETLDALIKAQECRKKALMQHILTGKKRVKGAKGKWKTVALGEMLTPITRTVPKPAGAFLAAGIRSHGKGVFLKPEFKPEEIALDELFEIKVGDLIVNITFAWEGAAAIVPENADGALVSHRFPTFLFKEGIASRSFFRHFIRSKRFVFECGLASPGGAGRNRVLSKSGFLEIELNAPPFEEQEAIGAILDTAQHQLTLLRAQREALDQQKRGLMQRLLTGKIRVKA